MDQETIAIACRRMRGEVVPDPPGERGFYYLHVNGDLIFKRFEPDDDSDFVRKVWPINTADRGTAWILCVEALAMGANEGRVRELAAKWGLTDEDGQEFVKRAGLVAKLDGDAWCVHFSDFVNVQESQVGFGPTVLDALAALARDGFESRREASR